MQKDLYTTRDLSWFGFDLSMSTNFVTLKNIELQNNILQPMNYLN